MKTGHHNLGKRALQQLKTGHDASCTYTLEQQISEEEGVWPKGNLYHIEMEQLASPLLLTRFDPRIAGSLLRRELLRAGEVGLAVADVVGGGVDGEDDGAVGVGGAAGGGIVGEG